MTATTTTAVTRTLPATAAAITKNARLALDSNGDVSHAGATGPWIGTAMNDLPSAASGNRTGDGVVTVRLINDPGTWNFIAASAIAVGDEIDAAANGEVDNVAADAGTFMALTAASAQGDVIEALRTENAASP